MLWEFDYITSMNILLCIAYTETEMKVVVFIGTVTAHLCHLSTYIYDEPHKL